MPATAMKDPLSGYVDGPVAKSAGRTWPIPLLSTGISVDVRGGLAVVETVRAFRNSEDRPVEVTLTFPVPGASVLVGLKAKVDGRDLVATSRPRKAARDAYEGALDEGKTAILHEELLRGVHMLSLGNLPPGRSAEVVVTFVVPVSFVSDVPTLSIPTTVGDVFGRSPLLDSDDLVTGHDVRHEADVTVTTDSGSAVIAGSGGASGKVTMDRPVRISVPGWEPGEVRGNAAGGRGVTLRVEPQGSGDDALDVSVLFDRSGSTNDDVLVADRPAKVWDVMRDGLVAALSRDLRPGDNVALFHFDDTAKLLGEGGASAVAGMVDRLGGPRGGTETGVAVLKAVKDRPGRDVLLLTDGRSHALDVQDLSARGCRVSVVLVGGNALDAMVGHLAVLTGGQTFVASGSDVEGAVSAALRSLRVRSGRAAGASGSDGLPSKACVSVGGAVVVADWTSGGADGPADALGAYAASMCLPGMAEDAATDLAVANGLCTHLTSLVLVDEAGERVQGIPASRKVPLMASGAPRPVLAALASGPARGIGAMLMAGSATRSSFSAAVAKESWLDVADPPPGTGMSFSASTLPFPDIGKVGGRTSPSRSGSHVDVRSLASRIGWGSVVHEVSEGILAGLDEDTRAQVERLAALPEVVALAAALGRSAVAVAVALVAKAATGDRSAGRLVNRTLKGAPTPLFEAAARAVGVSAA